MDTRDLVLPAAVFIGGALLGRFLGLKPIWRGALAALAVAGASKNAGLIDDEPAPRRHAAPRRKAVTRAARKRPVHKKSAPASE